MANAPKENQRVGDDLELGYALPSPDHITIVSRTGLAVNPLIKIFSGGGHAG